MKLRRNTLRGCYLEDDFNVFYRSRRIGRIVLDSTTKVWVWKIALGSASRVVNYGSASSLEEARRALIAAWRRPA
jgi:hypothetical protein